jgi:alkylglycerol monooxygenase
VHTQQIGKLGWFDRWFCSPSNHRVHHAVNDRYLDRNYGGILILWDRLFGSFEEECDSEPCVYGTRSPLRSFDPLLANVEVYWALARDAWHARSWRDKLRVWLMPPGWRPAEVAQRFPKPEFRLEAMQKFDPPMGRGARIAALMMIAGLLIGACWLLWNAHRLPIATQLAGAAAIIAGLWLMGTVSQLGVSRQARAAAA